MIVTHSYFSVVKGLRLNTRHFFIIKTPKKQEFQQVAIDNSCDIVSKDFMKLYKKYPDEAFPFFVLDTTLPLGHILFFWKNLLEEVYKYREQS